MKEKMIKKQPIAVSRWPLVKPLTANRLPLTAKRGFTLIEMLVVLLIFSFIVGGILTVFINNQHTKQLAEAITEAQQSARLSSQILTTDLRNIGYKIDVENKQIFIEYASPYDIVFNGNIKPYPDNPDTPGYPQAIDPSSSPNSVGPSGSPYYQPGMQYETGAETYRYTLDYNDDGTIDSTDRSANAISKSTRNPDDYMLIRRVYGKLSDGTNGGSIQQIAIVRGPDQYPNQADTTIYPLFTYWYDNDNDPSTPPVLWGDSDGNGILSDSEIINLQPIVNINVLKKIQRITITVTTETPYPNRRGKYNRIVVKTDVTPGNVAKPIRMIIGHVYNDANSNGTQDGGESGISGWKVWLNTGDATTTDANGIYTFSVPASVYRVMTQAKVGWTPTTDVSKEVNTDTGDVHLETDSVFGFHSAPTGWVRGFVYADSTGQPCEYDPDSGDVPMDSIYVFGNNFSGTTDSIGYYYIKVNAGTNDTNLIWVDTLSGVCIDTIDTLGGGDYATYFPIPGNKDEMKFTVKENDTAEINFYRKKATGIPCTTHVYIPNGGEIWSIGDIKDVIYYVDGIDDRIDTADIYYSDDNGAAGTWKLIGYRDIGVQSDTDTFEWDIDTSFAPTFDALIKVVAQDSGGNICYDASDSVFTLIAPWGYPTLYFRRQWVNDTITGDTVLTDQKDSLHFMRYLSPRAPTSGAGSGAESLGVALAETTLSSGMSAGSRAPYIRYWNPDSAWGQWISKKWSPYRESIPPDTWRFYLWAQSYAENGIGQLFSILESPTIKINKVSKRDSLGDTLSDTTLIFYDKDASSGLGWGSKKGEYKAINYDSNPPVTTSCTLIKEDTLEHEMKECSVYIYVPVAFKMKRWNRIVVELWFDPSTLTIGIGQDMTLKSYFYYNTIDYKSRFDIPHY